MCSSGSSSEERNLKNPLQTTWTKKPFRLFCSRQYGHVILAFVLVPEMDIYPKIILIVGIYSQGVFTCYLDYFLMLLEIG